MHCPNDKIYDDEVFADRFRYQMNMVHMRVLIRLSGLVHAHIAYEIAVSKITADICPISHYLACFDAVEFNRLPSQNDKMYVDEVFACRFRYQFTMFETRIFIWLSRLLQGHIAYEVVIPKFTTVNLHDVRNDFRYSTVLKRSFGRR